MLKRLILYICLFTTGPVWAQVPWGIGVEDESHDLAAKDDSSGMYYSAYPLQFNKGFIFGCRIVSSSFNPQIRLIDAQNKVVHEAGGEKISDKEYRMLTHVTIPSDGMYTLVVTSPYPGMRGKYTLTNYLFQPVQFSYRAKFNFCERLAFLFNHAFAGFQFVDTLPQGKTQALVVDSSAAFLSQSVYTNVVYNYTGEATAKMHYENCIANLRACLGADYWAEKKSENLVEGEEQMRMSSEFSLKPAYGSGAVFQLRYLVNTQAGTHRVEIRVWK